MQDNNQFGSLEEFLSGEHNEPEQTEEEKAADTPPTQDTEKTPEELAAEEKPRKMLKPLPLQIRTTKEKPKTPPANNLTL